MTSDDNDQTNLFDNADGASAADSNESPRRSDYPARSENDWKVPTTSDAGMGDAAAHASAPDASPLMDGQVSDGSSAGANQFWNDGSAISGNAPASARVPRQEPQEQQFQQQRDEQQPPRGNAPQSQQYQPGPPMGGMPPQPYNGDRMAMSPESNNPNYLAGPTPQGQNTIQLDYWLSVFFTWIPSLIFFLTERDKNKLVDEHTKELLNFNITRMIVFAVTIIPFIGWIIGGIASLVLFVMAIMGAMKGPDEYAKGRTFQFKYTFRFIK